MGIRNILGIFGFAEFNHSGGGSSPLGPDTVGTEQIIDGAVEMQDLNKSVKDEMITRHDHVTEEELNSFDV